MKWRRVALLVVAFSLMGGSLLFADSASQKVKLLLNGRETEDGGYMIDGKTYVPVRNLEGLVDYDESSKTVNYYKPNVHISLWQTDDKMFGDVKEKAKIKFSVLSQIDNLKTKISAVRVNITAPDGSTKVIQTDEIKDQQDHFWFRTQDYTYDFKSVGKYTIGFYMQASNSSDYVLVSEKEINVLK